VQDSAIDLKFDCVVGGVETAEQVEIIGRLGCSTMQGYFFCQADAAGRGRDLHRQLPHVG
jgi:EAL domain-containing protein (putative c-di-GMP-specific phosphodiesterase class I)